MMCVNFILNEKKQLEAIGYSNEPTTSISVVFSKSSTEIAPTDLNDEFFSHSSLMFRDNIDPKLKQDILETKVEELVKKAINLLNSSIDRSSLIQQINS